MKYLVAIGQILVLVYVWATIILVLTGHLVLK